MIHLARSWSLPYNEYGLFTKCAVKMAGLDIDRVLLCVFMDQDGVGVHTLAKKERGQYPASLTEQAWSIYGFRMAFGKFSLRDAAGSPERAR